jgi:hypothetical protein
MNSIREVGSIFRIQDMALASERSTLVFLAVGLIVLLVAFLVFVWPVGSTRALVKSSMWANEKYFSRFRFLATTVFLIGALTASFILVPDAIAQFVGSFGVIALFAFCVTGIVLHLGLLTIKHDIPFLPLIFGFLFTAGPRWLALPAPTAREFVPPALSAAFAAFLLHVALAFGLLALAAAVALAHHGWSGYVSSKVLTLTGTIREAGYEHPHGLVKLETPGKIWLVVLAPPSRMENRGDEGRYLDEAADFLLGSGNLGSVVLPPARSDHGSPARAVTSFPRNRGRAGVMAAMAELYHGLSSLPRTRSIRTSSGAIVMTSPSGAGSITSTPHLRSAAAEARALGWFQSGTLTEIATITGVLRPIASATTDSARLSAMPAASLLSEPNEHGATSTNPNGGLGRIASSK